MDTAPATLTVFMMAHALFACAIGAGIKKLEGRTDERVEWLDITGRDDELRQQGIDPDKALRELHVKDAQGQVHQEMAAYILLLSRVPRLKPLAWLIGLPVIRPSLAWLYHRWVARRLGSRID